MRTHTLRVFCDVIETGSFTQAAQKNGYTTSHASRAFQEVEDHFGASFAVRDRQHFEATREGNLCHDYCLEILRTQRAALRAVEEEHQIADKTFSLAACLSFGLHQLQPLLRRFRQSFPDFQFDYRYAHIDQVHDLVLNGPMDLGLTAYPRRLRGLVVLPIRDERLVLVCHPQHRLATRAEVPLAALRGLPIIAWEEIPWNVFLKKVPDSQRHMFEPRYLFNEVEMVKQAVEKGVGIAVLPAGTVTWEVANHLLAAVPFENGRYAEPVAVIHREARVPNIAMKQFIKFLKQPSPVGAGEGGKAG
jgi:LysR family transcriptional regulator, transcriptional activator of the cysJI operon